MIRLAGVDIGGTKCAVCLGEIGGSGEESAADPKPVRVTAERRFPTPGSPDIALRAIETSLDEMLAAQDGLDPQAIGVSCGGPLDSQRGLILSPPNLASWDRVDVLSPLEQRFGIPAGLQNDANAGALAEWGWGAGRGCRNLIFLTFGTGMGAGLILDGRLYTGANDMAGEVGHIRLAPDGPEGYGKAGSFEGFCSGGGIARLARAMAEAELARGGAPGFSPTPADLPSITAASVGAAAERGDALARAIFKIAGEQLGRALAILVDILNPERIVIGSIYARQSAFLAPYLFKTLREEALDRSLSVCKIVPAALGGRTGTLASIAVALQALEGIEKATEAISLRGSRQVNKGDR